MSALEAAGCALSRFQSVSVVPMIQCLPTYDEETDFSVRRIRPVDELTRSFGTTRWMPWTP